MAASAPDAGTTPPAFIKSHNCCCCSCCCSGCQLLGGFIKKIRHAWPPTPQHMVAHYPHPPFLILAITNDDAPVHRQPRDVGEFRPLTVSQRFKIFGKFLLASNATFWTDKRPPEQGRRGQGLKNERDRYEPLVAVIDVTADESKRIMRR
jgi:hypothetical protein